MNVGGSQNPVGPAVRLKGSVVVFILGMVTMFFLLLVLGATITFHFKGEEISISKEKIEKLREE